MISFPVFFLDRMSSYSEINFRCLVFHPSNIDRFRNLGIRKIFTIRPRQEPMVSWDEEADRIIDNDDNFIRRRIEIMDHPSADLLHHIPAIVEEIHASVS